MLLQLLERKIVTFVKHELKKLRKVLDSEYLEDISEELSEDEEVMDGEEDGKGNSNREEFLKITLNVLKTMKEERLADSLQSSKMLFSIKLYTAGLT